MLAVDSQDTDAIFAGLVHDSFTGHDEDFFGSDGDVLAGADGGEGGFKAGGADDGDEDNIGGGKRRQPDQSFFARKNLGRRAERLLKFLRFGGIENGDGG